MIYVNFFFPFIKIVPILFFDFWKLYKCSYTMCEKNLRCFNFEIVARVVFCGIFVARVLIFLVKLEFLNHFKLSLRYFSIRNFCLSNKVTGIYERFCSRNYYFLSWFLFRVK